ncbi:protein phosphatase 2C-like domain-containing protein 1 [Tympanuchus pallidicinctus]|uniref:protein phosphatase 2C-like domain-containing protein 1 n=1 Tax=Tympanuchus pallidicinctus TaxID=109042 RepID=UPI002286E081|nr:protein phosphatase 2C-like domain-containing protein 1 [Tympanuchus pallidicinctus]
MTWEEKSQDKARPPNDELCRDEEDHLEKIMIASENADATGISILCSACQQAIYPHHFFHHKKTHKALTLLGCDSSQTRVDAKTLLAQRQKLISKVTELPKNSERHRQKINTSFEFLMDGHAPRLCCDHNTNSVNTLKEVKNSSIKALSISEDKNSIWQRDMEDRFFVVDNYGSRTDTCFLGLIDGHHGMTAAETVAAELPLLFLDQLAQTDPSYKMTKEERQILDSLATVITEDYREKERIFSDRQENKTHKTNTYEWIHKAYTKAFWRMDRLLQLGRNEVSRVRWSGCSAVTCLMERLPSENTDDTEHFENSLQSSLTRTTEDVAGLLHIANIGNVHAVLCKNGKSYRLSEEHSTSNVREKKRILQNGGNISPNEPDGLVEGHLRTTRGLGYHGDPALKGSVIPVPHSISVPIDDSCQFLILASNGLWEVLDYNEVCALTLTTFTHYLRTYERIQQNGASLYNCLYLLPCSEEELSDSKATNYQQVGTEMQDSSMEIFLPDSKSSTTHGKPRCSRMSYLQSENGDVPKETDDHKNQADPELTLFSNDEIGPEKRGIKQSDSSTQISSEEMKQSEDRKVYLRNSSQPHSQTTAPEETDIIHATSPSYIHKQLPNKLTVRPEDMKQTQNCTKASLSIYDSDLQQAEKTNSKISHAKPVGYTGHQLLKAPLPVDCKTPTHFEEDIKTYLASCESQIAGKGGVTSKALYDNAASYISEQLVKAALHAGSRDNITILIVLLNGCDKLPN